MKNFKIEFKWALIFSVFTLLWMFFEKSMGWHDELIAKQQLYTNLVAIPYIIIFVLALREKRERSLNGYMTWKQGVLSGSIMSIIIAVLAPLVQYISNTYISPAYFKHIIEYTVQHNVMSQQGAKEYFSLGSYMIQSVFGSLAMGIVTAALVSLFLKKEPKEEE